MAWGFLRNWALEAAQLFILCNMVKVFREVNGDAGFSRNAVGQMSVT